MNMEIGLAKGFLTSDEYEQIVSAYEACEADLRRWAAVFVDTDAMPLPVPDDEFSQALIVLADKADGKAMRLGHLGKKLKRKQAEAPVSRKLDLE
jgi:hypothetical protein